jgi:ABC-2 type transport system permease protein
MLNALLYLRFTSAKNWLRVRLRRLRQPKYLFGAIVGCAYFYLFFFRPFGGGRRGPHHPAAAEAVAAVSGSLPVDLLPMVTAFGTLALFSFLTMMWVVPAQRAALGFSEAEIAFLFPAPVTRRALVHFRLLSAQLRSLIGAIVMMLFSNRWTIFGGSAFTHAVGWWFIFSMLNLHFSGASFTLTRLSDLGLGAWRRRVLALLVVAAVVAASVFRLPSGERIPVLAADNDLGPVSDWAVALTGTAPLSWMIWPLQRVLGPFLAPDTMHFLAALLPALAILTLHYLWVVSSAVAFEDASLEHAEKRSARAAAWRAGKTAGSLAPTQARRAPFRLHSTGRPEYAFLWKNLLSTWQYFTPRVLLGSAAVIVGTAAWLKTQPASHALLPLVGIVTGIFALYVLVVGPQFARQDIRGDLGHADLLKTFPLAGWQIIAGELLTPVVVLSAILWLALLVITLTLQPTGDAFSWLSPVVRVVAAVCLGLIVPPLVCLQLLVPNAAALFFPGWFQMSRTRGGGPEVIGQRMIFFFAQVLTMALALLPAVGVAGLLIFIAWTFIGPVVAMAIGTFFVLATLVAEVGFGLWLLGRRFERLDLSAELQA